MVPQGCHHPPRHLQSPGYRAAPHATACAGPGAPVPRQAHPGPSRRARDRRQQSASARQRRRRRVAWRVGELARAADANLRHGGGQGDRVVAAGSSRPRADGCCRACAWVSADRRSRSSGRAVPDVYPGRPQARLGRIAQSSCPTCQRPPRTGGRVCAFGARALPGANGRVS